MTQRSKRGSFDNRRVYEFYAGKVIVSGHGSDLQFIVQAQRDLASGRTEYVELRLNGCRYSVTMLLRELAAMHARDRNRIHRELAQIEAETRVLTTPVQP